MAEASAAEKRPIGDTELCLAECRWAVRHEQVQHLDDLLLRRTRLGMCLANGGAEIFAPLKDICITELGWDEQHWQSELTRYQDIWQRFYYFPDQKNNQYYP